jgi:hypothetical protein
MNITGRITGIKYKVHLADDLQKIEASAFNINTVPTACIINDGKHSFAISKWVSPKRTRSYPYERVYNTLNISKKITVIPIVKDEGAKGDRDFIQWDTVSLMSLLDVFVIFAYYNEADKSEMKITTQKFNNKYVISKIKEIEQYHSSALHWNLNELNANLHNIIDKVKTSYAAIEKSTGVKLHGFRGLDNFKNKIGKDVSQFMEFSRGKAEKAQSREFVTVQPKEILSTLTKAKITITNYLGGQYFFTVDEIKIAETLSLIEGKHTVNAVLPGKGDIKDGLLKMILYSNLSDTKVNGKKIKCKPILELTSTKLKVGINSKSSAKGIENFFTTNNFNTVQKNLVTTLFIEAKSNNFTVNIKQVK